MIYSQSIQTMIILAIVSLWIPWRYRGEIGKFYQFTWSAFLLSAAWSTRYVQGEPGPAGTLMSSFPCGDVELHQIISANTVFLLTLLLPMIVLNFSQRAEKLFIKFAVAFFLVDAVVIYSGHFNNGVGLLHAGNFDAAVAIVTIPLFIAEYGIFSGIASITFLSMMIFINGETSKAAFFVGFMAWLAASKLWRWFGAGFGIAAGGIYLNREFLDNSGRFEVWLEAINRMQGKWIFGHGAGFYEAAQYLSGKPQPKGGEFLALHNDYLQVVHEFGLPLGLLFAAMVGKVLWDSRHRPKYLAASTAYAFVMLTYSPVHFVLSAMIGLVLIRESMVSKNYVEPKFSKSFMEFCRTLNREIGA